MKFSKEDIQKVYKTSPLEDSLLVFQSSNDTLSYVEFALIMLREQRLDEEQIKHWINAVDRFKDCYLHEQGTPIRIRLKQPFYPIHQVQNPSLNSHEEVIDWLNTQELSFDVQKPPLFLIYLIETGIGQVFCLIYHHLLFDGVSVQLALAGLDPSKRISFTDWTPQGLPQPQEKKEISPFSLERLVPPPVQSKKESLSLTFKLSDCSYETIMLNWLTFLKKASGSETLVVGEVLSARDASMDASAALGYFIQTWPLEITGDLSIEQLQAARTTIKQLATGWVKDHFTQNAFDHCWVVEPSLNSNFETYFYSNPHYVLSLIFCPVGNDLELKFCWNLEKIDRQAAQEISRTFYHSLNSTNHPDSIPIHLPKQQNLLERWDQMCTQYGDQIAVEDHLGNAYTYYELDKASNRLANAINIKKGDCVGVFTSYSAHIPISFLAILKAGGIYVPLDPTVANDRRTFIIENSGISTLISDLNPSSSCTIVNPTELNDEDTFNRPSTALTDTCYLIYTSGTTGVPKGCAVNHLNLLNLFEGTDSLFNFSASDRWILAHSYGFDFSTWEIWGALLHGAKLYIPDRTEVQDTFKFHELLKTKQINVLNQTPKSFYNLMLVDEHLKGLNHIDYIIFGGDKLQTTRLTPWMETYPNMQLINMYGITETTVHVTFKKVEPEEQSNIGFPLPGYSITLKNEIGETVPQGFLGEIYVYGNGVCNGYFQNPKLSDEKFSYDDQGRYYKSGDLAWSIGNSYYYMGRRDRQVKIRGFRIELGEIEFSLKKQVNTCDFIVLFVDEKLFAFYKGEVTNLTPDQFRGLLADYALPSSFIHVQEFPLNQSGKIDEKALIARINKTSTSNAVSPWSTYFKEILGPNIDDSRTFLQNGGDSIIAIRLIHRLRKDGFELNVQQLFNQTPINALVPSQVQAVKEVNYIEQFHREHSLTYSDSQFYFPLLEAQEGILFDCLTSELPSLYVEQLTYEVPASYSPELIQQAYTRVCQANPLLTSKITRKNGTYLFVAGFMLQADCQVIKQPFDDFIAKDFERGFNLFESLSRLTILPGPVQHQLIWTHHHLLLDGWSLGVFSQLMLQALEGKEITSTNSFISFCCQQALHKPNTGYWKTKEPTAEVDPLIPYLGDRNPVKAYEKTTVFIKFKDRHKLSANNLSQHAFLLSGWSAFIGVLFNKSIINIGNVVSLRGDETMEDLGMFIRTLPFQTTISPEESFEKSALQISSVLQQDAQHNLEPINAYVKENQLSHLFVFENYPIDFALLETHGIRVGAFRERTGAVWTTIVYPKPEGFEISVLHDTTCYSSEYVKHILTHFNQWIGSLIWTQKISESIGVLAQSKVYEGLHIEHQCTHILGKLKRVSPQAYLKRKAGEVSYTSLWSEAEQLSKSLAISSGEAVGIDVKSTHHFTVSILAVWIANGVACPVDKRYPEGRKEFIFKNSGVRKIVHSNEDALAIQVISEDKKIYPKEASFILHTSGSTGEPKGVIQTHQCLINLISWNAGSFGLAGQEVILQLSSFGFDASFHEVLLSLSLGATLIEVPLEFRLDIQQIRDTIIWSKATLAWIPARLLNAVLEVDPEFFDACISLKNIVTTGEALVVGQELRNYLERSRVALLNYYGPTETHVITAKAIGIDEATTQPTIGSVLPNTSIVLVENNSIVPTGLPGELWAAGDHLALGYLNDEHLTQEKFVTFNGITHYKTGDWAFVDSTDNFHFLGRKDDQLKIRGFRVEPLEVERLLIELRAVQQCCILVHDQALYAFIVSDESIEVVKKQAVNALPDFMIPSQYFLLEALPINNNGKADRAKLKTLIGAASEAPTSLDRSLLSNQCWIAVLGHDRFSINDRFDSIGGNSILLMKMQAWLEKNAGCFVSVKSLLAHNTPNQLEQLIQESLSERPIEFPETYALNALQQGILLSELGNDWGLESPFILRFRTKLTQRISSSKWKEAVQSVINQFPYLIYTIAHAENPKLAVWTNTPQDHRLFSDENLMQWDAPLIRFIQHNDHEVEFIYHHILLDGLGMNVLLNRLIACLHDNKFMIGNPVLVLLNYKTRQQRLEIKTINKEINQCVKLIDGTEYDSINEYCSKNLLLQSEFFYGSIAMAHRSTLIAVADISNHPGIPGMFTELIPLVIDASSYKISRPDQEPRAMDIVVNYMVLDVPKDIIRSIEVSQPKRTKYPFEWQITDFGNRFEINFYTPVEQEKAEQLLINWWQSIVDRISGKEVQSFRKDDIHEDFDF